MSTFGRRTSVGASRERVWNATSYFDTEPEHRHRTREVCNESMEGITTPGRVAQNFMGAMNHRLVALRPTEAVVSGFLSGLAAGMKAVTLDTAVKVKRVVAERHIRSEGPTTCARPRSGGGNG